MIAYLQRAARLPAAASRAALGVMCNADETFAAGKCAWQRLGQRVGGAPTFAHCDESAMAPFRQTAGAAGFQEGEEISACCSSRPLENSQLAEITQVPAASK